MNFHVGQEVVCIVDYGDGGFFFSDDGVLIEHPSLTGPVKGEVCTIVEIEFIEVGTVVGNYMAAEDIVYLRFEGKWHEDWFDAFDFRPVKTTSIEVFRQMLVTPPQKVEA